MTPLTETAAPAVPRARFPLRLERSWRPWLWLWGVRPDNAHVDLDQRRLDARFGFYRLSTDLDNITEYRITGPYRWWSAIGVRLSMRGGDASFCGTARGGVCLRFREPVPWARIFHPPALTVTPEDMDGFVAALQARGISGTDERRN
jgi:hypothetical protein